MKNLIAPMLFLATPVLAEAPKVVTDIAPVHALVSQVMAGVGAPGLVIPSNASPHNFAMRPSQARMLEQADAVIWIGHALTPWLEGPIDRLADSAAKLELMEVEGVHLLGFREGALFEGGAHDHGEGHDADHGDGHEEDHKDHDHGEHGHEDTHKEKDHDDHGHKEEGHKEAGHDDHGHEDEDHKDHDHAETDHKDHDDHDHAAEGGSDPHIWLSPENGAVFLTAIADQLSQLDPENAATYAANAAQGRAMLTALEAEIDAILAPVRGKPFIVLHDAFHYFEDHFDIEATGAISPSDAEAPGAARISALRAALPDSQLQCAFSEPQTNGRIIKTVIEGFDVQTSNLDPLGAEYKLGSALYPDTLKSLAQSMADCLSR